MSELIKNHPNIGLEVECDGVKGKITGYKKDFRTHGKIENGSITVTGRPMVMVRIKPNSGARAFWVGPFAENDAINQPISAT